MKSLEPGKKQPLHNAASHPADAFMTFADGFYHEEQIDEYLDSHDKKRYTANNTTGY